MFNSIWKILFDKGDIYLDQYSGWYSITMKLYSEEELIKTDK